MDLPLVSTLVCIVLLKSLLSMSALESFQQVHNNEAEEHEKYYQQQVLMLARTIIFLQKNGEGLNNIGAVFEGRSSGGNAWIRLGNGTEVEVFPTPHKLKLHRVFNATVYDGRRRLSPFRMCSNCRCCDATQSVCLRAPCCFSIVCDAPNQPFGVCSLTPFTCTCITC